MRLEQLGESVSVAAVATEMRQILRHEIDFARALQLQQLGLANDLV